MERERTTLVKFIKDANGTLNRLGGYLVIWGDPGQKDLHGEYFTPDTDLALDWFERRPALYQHGLDAKMGSQLVGHIDTLEPDDIGLWAEAQVQANTNYRAIVAKLVEKGVLAWSSGTMPHLARIDRKTGEIKSWPIIEGSLTPTPAEPRGTWVGTLTHYADPDTAKAAYKSLDIPADDRLAKAALVTEDEAGDEDQRIQADHQLTGNEDDDTGVNDMGNDAQTQTPAAATVDMSALADLIKQGVQDVLTEQAAEQQQAAIWKRQAARKPMT
jgi:hypothetical protein